MIDYAKKIKIVVTDIDGTLLSHTKGKIPESAIVAFKELLRNGVMVFLASGRNYYLIKRSGVLNFVKPDGFITMNGANVIIDNKVIYEYPIPSKDVDALVKFAKRLRFGLTLIEENEGHINIIDERVISAHEKFGTRFPQPRSYPDHYDRVVYQAIAFCDSFDESLFLPHLQDCKSARWDEYAVDIMPKDSDKSKGILAMLSYYKLQPENVLAIGDGLNDREMLNFAGLGVAMGNAHPDLKEDADYVTDHIDDDGWAKALRHYKLID